MTKQIEAVYENGVLRPVHPLHIPEGEHLPRDAIIASVITVVRM